MALPKITESMIRAGAGPESFHRGERYYRGGAISNTACADPADNCPTKRCTDCRLINLRYGMSDFSTFKWYSK